MDKREEYLVEFAQRCPSGKTSTVTLSECGICGYVEWVCSEKNESGTPSYLVQEADRCLRCSTVRMRNPEVYEWVLATLIFQQHRLARKASAGAQQSDSEKGTG